MARPAAPATNRWLTTLPNSGWCVRAGGDDTVKGPMFDGLRGFDWPDGPWALRSPRNAATDRWATDPAGPQAALPVSSTEP